MSPRSRVPTCVLLACFVMTFPATAVADACDPTRQKFPTLDITPYEYRRGDANCPSAQRIYTDCLDENGALVKSVRGSCVPVPANDDEDSAPDGEN